MKFVTTHKFFISCTILSLLFFSCGNLTDLHIPEKITVKSEGAKYRVPLGTGEAYLREHLDAAALQEQLDSAMADTAQFSVFDYNPGASETDVQRFVVSYDLPSIPLDVDEMMEGIDLTAKLNEGMSQTITVPNPFEKADGSPLFSETINFDINKIIQDNFSGVSSDPITVVELGYEASVDSTKVPPVSLSISPAYKKMRFNQGKVVLYFFWTIQPTETFSLTLNPSLYTTDDYDNEIPVTSAGNDGVDITKMTTKTKDGKFPAAKIELDLAGKTISSTLRLTFSGTMSGGKTPDINGYKSDAFSVSIALEDTDISYLSGISSDDMTDTSALQKTFSQTVSMSAAAEYLESATISEGYLQFYTTAPTGWSGITPTTDITLSGAISLDTIADNPEKRANDLINKYADLAEKTLTVSQDLAVNATVSFTLDDAVLTFDSGEGLTMVCDANIKTLSDAKIKTSALGFSKDVTQPLPDAIKNYIKEMKINSLGIAGAFSTSLDIAELYLNVKGTSDVFNIKAGDFEESIDVITGTEFTLSAENLDAVIRPADIDNFDFHFEASVTGANNSSLITVNSLTLGDSYTIAAKLGKEETEEEDASTGLVFDWEYIKIDTSSVEDMKDSIDTGLNLEEIVSGLFDSDDEGDSGSSHSERKDIINTIINSIELQGIEAYLYITRPTYTGDGKDPLDIFGNFNGWLYAIMTKNGTETTTDLVGTETAKQQLTLLDYDNVYDLDALLENESEENKTGRTITTDVFTTAKNAGQPYYSAKVDGLCDVVNKKPANLKIGYEIGVGDSSGEVTLYPSTLESLTGKLSISMSVALMLPLKIGITQDIEISDLMDLFDSPLTNDLLGRDAPSENDDEESTIEKAAKLFDHVAIYYELQNNTGIDITASLTATNKSGVTYLTKSVILDNAPHDITLAQSEILEVCKASNYPFTPVFSLKVAQNDNIVIRRNAFFAARNIVAEVETGGEYTVDLEDD